MNPTLARKKASATLGVALYERFQRLELAVGREEIAQAAMDLGTTFNDNIEFLIWVCKQYGGLNPAPIEPKRTTELLKMPSSLLQ